MKPITTDIKSALKSIESAERDPNHSRSLARKAIKRWRSDAEKLKLGVSNQIHTGAPSLRTDDILARADGHEGRIGRK